jgi:hypothetical protein
MSTVKLEKKATRVKASPKADGSWTMPLVGGPKTRVSKYFRLAYLAARVEDKIKIFKPRAIADLLTIWCQHYFDKKVKPPKSYVAFDRKEVDMTATFVVSFSSNLNSLVKEKELIASGLTPTQFLSRAITENGVDHKAAVSFVNNEVEFVDKVNLTESLHDLKTSEDENAKSFAAKLNKHLRSGCYTAEELKAGLKVEQCVELKEGVLERLLKYCNSVEEMTALLNVCKQGAKIQNTKVGTSLPQAEQITQMSATVAEFVTGE